MPIYFIRKSNLTSKTSGASITTSSLIDTANKTIYLNSTFANSQYCYDPGADYYSGTKALNNGVTGTFKNTGVDYFSNKLVIKDDIYNNYTTFIIEDIVGLQIFADNCWHIDAATGDSSATFGGLRFRNFYLKTVLLDADIDFNNTNFSGIGWTNHWDDNAWDNTGFAGTFDGQGHTIKNFNFNGKYYQYYSKSEGGFIGIGATTYTMKFMGFFNFVHFNATIQNLRLNNFNANSIVPSANDRVYVGGLVGHSNGGSTERVAIINCSIEKFNAKLGGNAADEEYVAGIIAKGYADISYCYIDNVHESGDVTNFVCVGPFDLQNWEDEDYPFTASDSAVSNCIINNYHSTYFYNLSSACSSIKNVYLYLNFEFLNTIVGDMFESNYLYFNSAGEVDYYDPKSTNAFSSLSSISKEGGEEQSCYWYNITDYNGGFPYLRSFINWASVTFDTDADKKINTDKTIYVPSEIKSTLCSKVATASSQIGMADTTISAVTKNGYKFAKWETSTSIDFIATYTEETYTFNFAKPTCSGTEINVSASKSSLIVKYNMTIAITTTYSASATTINYNIGGTNITYTLPAKYTTDSYGTINTTKITNGMKVPDLSDGSAHTIIPTIKLKSYNITFG